MILDLGAYAWDVIAAYTVAIILLLGLVVGSVIKSHRVYKQLQALETQHKEL